MVTKCLFFLFAIVAACSAGLVPATYTVGTYASTYNAHAVNHAYAAPYYAHAPLTYAAAPAAYAAIPATYGAYAAPTFLAGR